MKALLMYRDRDFDAQATPPWNADALSSDLGLDTLLDAMGGEDEFVRDVARTAILTWLTEPDAIRYRQAILKDCIANPETVHRIYDLAVATIEGEKKNFWGIFLRYPDTILHRSVEVLGFFVHQLRALRAIAESEGSRYSSHGLRTFFAMLSRELSEEYFAEIGGHLHNLKLPDGVLISAEIGAGNKSTNLVLRKPKQSERSWWKRLFAERPTTFSYRLDPRDENGFRMLSELEAKGINLVANALAQSNDHILSFFVQVRAELAFHIACMNLHERLKELGEPVCFPEPVETGERQRSFRELYDVCLALTAGQKVVGNDLEAAGKDLIVITGANQGGKSTFLRSFGLAQIMMQAGMFVPAAAFRANTCGQIITHFKREEDVTMKSGKLDEELTRMTEIADHLKPDALVLFNKSFAATNEKEGSQIATQIVDALIESKITVGFVTHLYELAHGLFDRRMPNALFLRAERKADRSRTFKLREGEPLSTSYGRDLYERRFDSGGTVTRRSRKKIQA